MMMLLKVVGAAYDIHLTNREKIKKAHKDTYSDYADEEPMDPSFTDLFHFIFSAIGIVVGPHMRLRTYQDYYHLPFSRSCNSLALIQKVLFKVVLICIVTTIIKRLSPLDYVLTEEFAERSFIYKCIFNALHSTRYRMCIAGYIFLLGQLLSALFGLGAYPTSLKSVTCHGPTVDYSHLKNITKEEADKLEYDFGTCEPVDQFNILFSPWMSQYWKSWNKGVQYFLARYIHTELLENVIGPYYRPILTMLISTYWHGLELGWYIGLAVCGLHVVAEKPYHKIEKYITGWKSNAFVVMMWIVNTFIFHQTMMSSAILEGNAALTHVAAMKYIPFIILLIYFIVGKLTLAHLQRNDALKKNTIIN